ncbi:MAG: GNAT family N-acetyltransferase [Oscillospiraceae bacterium]|nr:GNAT family N-acetyltransferase [Oscillospiraceae bacterium]
MNELRLAIPAPEHAAEVAAYRAEMLAAGSEFDGCGGLKDYEDAAEWITWIRLFEREETKPVPDWVTAQQYLLMQNERVLGMINMRLHINNEFLAEYFGHIGYSVRPSERRKGYATAMLGLALRECPQLGLPRVLVTALADNMPSRKVIEANGGQFERYTSPESKILVHARYWINL